MPYILKDTQSGEFFALPHGEDKREWTLDRETAHRFVTIERAQGGATVFWHIHQRALEVIPYATEEF